MLNMLSFIKKSKKRLMVKIKRKWVLARRKVSVSGEGRQEPDEEKEKERERETNKDREDRTRERKRVRERGGKSSTSLPGVCKHLPRGLLLPQPSLSGFVKALGALIPGCRMRRIEQRARS